MSCIKHESLNNLTSKISIRKMDNQFYFLCNKVKLLNESNAKKTCEELLLIFQEINKLDFALREFMQYVCRVESPLYEFSINDLKNPVEHVEELDQDDLLRDSIIKWIVLKNAKKIIGSHFKAAFNENRFDCDFELTSEI